MDEAAAILRKAEESARVMRDFAGAQGQAIAACARDVAARLAAGGRLLSFGNGGSACDAAHVAVEFVHPILEKRRAFPALALGQDVALLSAVGNDTDFARAFADQLELLARPEDVALGISTSGRSANVIRALRLARQRGLLTIGLTGRDGGELPGLVDHCFLVPSWSIHRIQETHVLFLHLLWDLVHVTQGAEDVV